MGVGRVVALEADVALVSLALGAVSAWLATLAEVKFDAHGITLSVSLVTSVGADLGLEVGIISASLLGRVALAVSAR